MTLAYYNPEAKSPLYTISNADTIDPAVLEITRNLATAQGFKPITNYTHFNPYEDRPFAIKSVEYTLDETGESYTQTITETPLRVQLDRGKLLHHELVISILTEASTALQSSPALADWWANDASYLRGSPMAQAAIAAFGLAEHELEMIARDCQASMFSGIRRALPTRPAPEPTPEPEADPAPEE